jgi:hypothetical protein
MAEAYITEWSFDSKKFQRKDYLLFHTPHPNPYPLFPVG